MKQIFDEVSIACSRLTTRSYSTSFSFGIFCLEKKLRNPIYSVYGFVRFADEIVDTFHQYDKASLFHRFRRDTMEALHDRISLNPVLNAFQATVHQYQIQQELIDLFLNSMEMDLYRKGYDQNGFKAYVTGSAEVVGLMCLRVFTEGNELMYEQLKPYAMSLGSAFQKVNFLRDLNADLVGLGRTYFPDMQQRDLNHSLKRQIEKSIDADLAHGFSGIKKLPRPARLGVYVAYMYYLALFRKIKKTPPEKVLQARIRIPNRHKATLLAYSFVRHRLNLI
jgi:15-cis-phytoene synthase